MDANSQTPVPGSAEEPAGPKTAPGRRGWYSCCLALVLPPIVVIAALLIWACSGPAPDPLRCLPPDAPLKIAVREPTDLALAFLKSDLARELAAADGSGGGKVPTPQEVEKLRFWLDQAFGSSAAASVSAERRIAAASRPKLLARMLEPIFRKQLARDPNVGAARIGQTLIVSQDRKRLDALMAERERILAPAGAGAEALSPDRRAELFLKEMRPSDFGAQEKPLRLAGCLLDLTSTDSVSGRLGLDNSLDSVKGHLLLPAGAGGAVPARLPAAEPASARLVSREALFYWAWTAPAGTDRWSSAGRFDALLEASEQDFDALFAPPVDTPEAVGAAAELRGEIRKLVEDELTGERAVFVVGQQRAGGQPLLAAAGALFEVRDSQRAWPRILRLLETVYLKSEDGKPPTIEGLPAEPFLEERSEDGCSFLELCYLTYPHGSGFRPAFGMAGKWFVACTSKDELKRIMTRAGAGGGTPATPSLAGDPELGSSDPAGASGLLLLRPAGRGGELADLMLAFRRDAEAGAEQPGDPAARQARAMAHLLDRLSGMRAEWQPQADGGMKILLDARLGPAPATAPVGAPKSPAPAVEAPETF